MILLFDIGNTHTHVGLADHQGVVKQTDIPTPAWAAGKARARLRRFIGGARLDGAAWCSVVPRITPHIRSAVRALGARPCVELNANTLFGLGIDYPRPQTIGPDRLANALAAKRRFGAPVVVVDFGTAVTLDVVDANGNYVGGIIAPGLAAMTEYLHEKTALLPRIKIRETRRVVGRSTEEAMLVGAVHGYRGLIHGLLIELKRELKARRLPVVATGGYAALMASKLPDITAVEPNLTLEGLRLTWRAALPTSGTLATTAQLHTQNTDTGTDGTAFTVGDGSTTFTINTGATDDSIIIEQGTYDSTMTFTQNGSAAQTYTFTTGGTVAVTANKLSVFAATTSAELSGVLSDENTSGGYMTDVMTTAGDLIYGNTSGVPARLGASNGGVLVSSATAPSWVASTSCTTSSRTPTAPSPGWRLQSPTPRTLIRGPTRPPS